MRYSLDLDVRWKGYDGMDGYDILIGGHKVARKPYDGSSDTEIIEEVINAFGALLRNQTGWSNDGRSEDW